MCWRTYFTLNFFQHENQTNNCRPHKEFLWRHVFGSQVVNDQHSTEAARIFSLKYSFIMCMMNINRISRALRSLLLSFDWTILSDSRNRGRASGYSWTLFSKKFQRVSEAVQIIVHEAKHFDMGTSLYNDSVKSCTTKTDSIGKNV